MWVKSTPRISRQGSNWDAEAAAAEGAEGNVPVDGEGADSPKDDTPAPPKPEPEPEEVGLRWTTVN